MKCWRCAAENPEGAQVCSACSAGLTRPSPASETGIALRRVYDVCGCELTLSEPSVMLNGLVGQPVDNRARGWLTIAFDNGLAAIYAEQLKRSGAPDAAFSAKVRICLDECGLSESAASQITGWMDEMIGWPKAVGRSADRAVRSADYVLGIDLGATYARAVACDGKRTVNIPFEGDPKGMSSVFGISDNRFVYGKAAEGLPAGSVEPCYKEKIKKYSNVVLGGNYYSPELFAAMQIRKLVKSAEEYLNASISIVAIAVPTRYNAKQRARIKTAAEIAGVPLSFVVNQTSAAGNLYLFNSGDQAVRHLTVCCMGAGGFEVSLFESGNGTLELCSTVGSDLVKASLLEVPVVLWAQKEFERAAGIDIRADIIATQCLRKEAVKAIHALSESDRTVIKIPEIVSDGVRTHDLELCLTREKFNELISNTTSLFGGMIKQAQEESSCSPSSKYDDQLRPEEFSEPKLIITGGAGRIPALRSEAQKLAHAAPEQGFDPVTAVAAGAAVMAYHKTFNSDRSVLTLESIAQPIGIETLGDVFTVLIEKNQPYPAAKSLEFSTSADVQKEVEIHVIQGEGGKASECASIGRYKMTVPPALKGQPRIKITVDIDHLYNVSVTGEVASQKSTEALTGRTIPDELFIRLESFVRNL